MTDDIKPELPPLPGHPEPHTYRWTALELAAIRSYGEACAHAAVAAAVAADRKDAERYLWLREQHTYDGEGDCDITRWYVQAGRDPVPCDPGSLDAEIDNAIRATLKP